MPLVDDNRAQVANGLGVSLPCKEQVEAFGCGDEQLGRLGALFFTLLRRRVPRPHPNLPGNTEVFHQAVGREFYFPGQRPYRRDPDRLDAFWFLSVALKILQVVEQDGHHEGIRLAASCRCVDKSAFTLQKRLPGLDLEGKRFPSLVAEPGFRGVEVLPPSLGVNFL